jgi:hypothetical protein
VSTLESIIDDARHALVRERTELAARIAADLSRLDLFDRLLAPGAQPLGHSGQNPFPAFLSGASGPASAGPLVRRLVSRLLTAGG